MIEPFQARCSPKGALRIFSPSQRQAQRSTPRRNNPNRPVFMAILVPFSLFAKCFSVKKPLRRSRLASDQAWSASNLLLLQPILAFSFFSSDLTPAVGLSVQASLPGKTSGCARWVSGAGVASCTVLLRCATTGGRIFFQTSLGCCCLQRQCLVCQVAFGILVKYQHFKHAARLGILLGITRVLLISPRPRGYYGSGKHTHRRRRR